MFAAGVGSEADDGGFRTTVSAVAIAQFGGARGPIAVIETQRAPGRSLIGTGVEILPDRAG